MDEDKVKFFLKMSEHARLDKEELLKVLPEAKFIEDTDTDTQCFTLRYLHSIIISFRGTQEPKDWKTDLDGLHIDYGMVAPYDNNGSPIKVHRGFIRAYKSVRDEIHRQFLKDECDIDNIYVCGHSLGGSLATLCAVDMQYLYPDRDIFCYVSGNPKVGNKAFVVSYNKRVPNTIRTYTRRDLVPKMPPAWIEKAFRQKSYHTAKGNPIGPRHLFAGLMYWIKNRFSAKQLPEAITNHAISFYMKYL